MSQPLSAKTRGSCAESTLVAAAQAGDRAAFEALVLPCQAGIQRWLTRLTRDRPSAEELFQESLFKAYVSLAGFRGESSFATWLASIARNTYLAWRKAQLKRPDNISFNMDEADIDESLDLAEGWMPMPSTPEEQLWQQELAAAIQKSLNALPPSLRDAFEQREQGGLSYAEIAQHQQVPVGTVRSRIHRAREAIAHDLKHIMESA
ncbi:MAG: sigma-70 family RNA polymerase sigma factor [Fluviibacter sp.]